MKRQKSPLVLFLVGAAVAALLGWQRGPLFSQSAPAPSATLDDSVVSFRVRFGISDSEPRTWDGSLAVTGGEVVDLRNWHPRPGDQLKGKTAWSLSTRRGQNFQRRAWEEELPTAPVGYLLVPGVIVDVKTAGSTAVAFRTPSGEFVVRPGELRAGHPAVLLGGSVIADRVPHAQMLSGAGGDYQNDFATMLGGADGEVWAAWVAYRNKGNEVFLRRFDGKSWGAALKATERPGDVFLAKMGRDRRANPWVVWSAQVNEDRKSVV